MIEIIPNFHPVFVHFPVALITISALFHIAIMIIKQPSHHTSYCSVLAHSTLWLAAITALPTVLFGWLASNTVNHDDAGHAAMLVHRSWAIATVSALVLLAAWDAKRHKIDSIPPTFLVVAVILVSGLVTTTAWHGAELVYRHGLGVMSIPPSGGEGHAHEHADGEGHGNGMPDQIAEPSHKENHELHSAANEEHPSEDHHSTEHPHETNPSNQIPIKDDPPTNQAAPEKSGHSHATGTATHHD